MRYVPWMIALLFVGALDAQSYIGSWSSKTYASTALVNPTIMSMAVDTISAEQAPAGFSFDFFGITCDRYRVGSNGYITLGNAANPPSTVTGWQPDLNQGGMVVAALWLDIESSDVISKYTPGSGGGPGTLVVRWGPVWTRTLPPSSGPWQTAPGAVLFELKLDTATGEISFQYGYPNWHAPETTGFDYSQCIAGPSGTGQEIICQPVTNTFSANGAMLNYNYNIEVKYTPAQPALMVTDGAPVFHGQAAAGSARDFGGQDINGGPTSPLQIRLHNSGTGGLNIGTISLTGADASLFSLDTSNTASSVSSGAYTTFEISFDPATVGAKSAQVEVNHNGVSQANPFTFEVAGTGMPTSIFPVVTVREIDAAGAAIGNGSPVTGLRDFGSINVGSQSAPAVVYIENTGTVTLNLGTLICNSAHYALDASTVPASLAPGASATFTVRFAPQSAGFKDAAVTFVHNDITTGNPFVVNFSGSAMGSGTSGAGSDNGNGGCAAGAGGGIWVCGLLAITRLRRRRV